MITRFQFMGAMLATGSGWWKNRSRVMLPTIPIRRTGLWAFPKQPSRTVVEAIRVPMQVVVGNRTYNARKVVNDGVLLTLFLCGKTLDGPVMEPVDGQFPVTDATMIFSAPLPTYEILPEVIGG